MPGVTESSGSLNLTMSREWENAEQQAEEPPLTASWMRDMIWQELGDEPTPYPTAGPLGLFASHSNLLCSSR